MPLPLFITYVVMSSLEEDLGEVLATEDEGYILGTEDGKAFALEEGS